MRFSSSLLPASLVILPPVPAVLSIIRNTAPHSMRKRFLYGSGVVLLVILPTLVLWQVPFKFEEYPENLNQTFISWAVSTIAFVLTITLGFILFRTGIKLYLERTRHHQGSRIE